MMTPASVATEFLLDSASLDDAAIAADLGFVRGVTTNPILAAESGFPDPRDRVERLLAAFPAGRVYHQLEAEDDEAAAAEIAAVRAASPERVVFKLPATPWHFQLAARLREQDVPVSMTAVYTESQLLLAGSVGAESVICYVDRAARLRPGGHRLVSQLRAAKEAGAPETRLIAASVKSAPQAVQAVLDGADAVTAPLGVLQEMAVDPLTEQALDGFRQALR